MAKPAYAQYKLSVVLTMQSSQCFTWNNADEGVFLCASPCEIVPDCYVRLWCSTWNQGLEAANLVVFHVELEGYQVLVMRTSTLRFR